jgi:hypothetical protein
VVARIRHSDWDGEGMGRLLSMARRDTRGASTTPSPAGAPVGASRPQPSSFTAKQCLPGPESPVKQPSRHARPAAAPSDGERLKHRNSPRHTGRAGPRSSSRCAGCGPTRLSVRNARRRARSCSSTFTSEGSTHRQRAKPIEELAKGIHRIIIGPLEKAARWRSASDPVRLHRGRKAATRRSTSDSGAAA